MTSVSISLHAEGPIDLVIRDDATVETIRAALDGPPSDRWRVPAHDLADILRARGHRLAAAALEQEEEAHVVTVAFA